MNFSQSPLFSLIGKAFAKQVLKGITAPESCQWSLYYLFCATIQGHQCITIRDGLLFPSSSAILDPSEKELFHDTNLINGFYSLPETVMQQDFNKLNLKPVVKKEDHFYLQKYFFSEQELLNALERLFFSKPNIDFNREEIEEVQASCGGVLNAEQRESIVLTLLSSIHLLTGGPGTGKSYTVKYLISVYAALCLKQKITPKILITAPTGKATAALKEKIDNEESFKNFRIDILTMHSALKIKKEKRDGLGDLFVYDLVIVDEASMVDLFLWKHFFLGLKKGSRVLLMGDHHQLPPIESGMVFEQLIESLNSSHLKVCMRTESPVLLDLAEAIRSQNEKSLMGLLEKKDSIQFKYIEYEKEKAIFEIHEKDFLEFYGGDPLESKVILTPVHQGCWGTEQINEQIYQKIMSNEMHKTQRKVPILITKTHYDLDLFNGDIGLLVQNIDKDSSFSYKDVITFPSKQGKNDIPLSLVNDYEYAYALSIHKSQGSEYDHVILFLPEGSDRFGRELLYTAVTRAKKSLTIFSVKGVISRVFALDGKKHSVLGENLTNRLILNKIS